MSLIDSHCHLTYEGLFERVGEVLLRAAEAGVTEFVTIATDLEDARKAFDIAERYQQVHVVAGVHPHQAAKVFRGWDAELERLIGEKYIPAAGEMGLDYHYYLADRLSQHKVFRRQLELANRYDTPVVIHCREAHDDVLAVLEDFPHVPRVVFHCFTGTLAEATQILDRGYWISLTGVVTFKRSDELREVAKLIPADRLMIETDAPYLSPEPLRSVRPNEPAYLIHTANCIAEQRGLSISDLTQLTESNTRRFFSLPVK